VRSPQGRRSWPDRLSHGRAVRAVRVALMRSAKTALVEFVQRLWFVRQRLSLRGTREPDEPLRLPGCETRTRSGLRQAGSYSSDGTMGVPLVVPWVLAVIATPVEIEGEPKVPLLGRVEAPDSTAFETRGSETPARKLRQPAIAGNRNSPARARGA